MVLWARTNKTKKTSVGVGSQQYYSLVLVVMGFFLLFGQLKNVVCGQLNNVAFFFRTGTAVDSL